MLPMEHQGPQGLFRGEHPCKGRSALGMGRQRVICCAQPGTLHQFLPTSVVRVGKASGPPSNQRFTPTRAITGFQSPKASGMGCSVISLSTALFHPGPAIGVQHRARVSQERAGQTLPSWAQPWRTACHCPAATIPTLTELNPFNHSEGNPRHGAEAFQWAGASQILPPIILH